MPFWPGRRPVLRFLSVVLLCVQAIAPASVFALRVQNTADAGLEDLRAALIPLSTLRADAGLEEGERLEATLTFPSSSDLSVDQITQHVLKQLVNALQDRPPFRPGAALCFDGELGHSGAPAIRLRGIESSSTINLREVVRNAVQAVLIRPGNVIGSALTLVLEPVANGWMMEFSDQGTGIPREVLDQLFVGQISTKDSQPAASIRGRGIAMFGYYGGQLLRELGGGFIEVDTNHQETGAWRLHYEPATGARPDVTAGQRSTQGTTVRWFFPLSSTGGLEEGERAVARLVETVWPDDRPLISREEVTGVPITTRYSRHYHAVGQFLFVTPEEWQKHRAALSTSRDHVIVSALRPAKLNGQEYAMLQYQEHTRLAVTLLQARPEVVRQRRVVVAGSGADVILEIVSDRLGARNVIGIEQDSLLVRKAQQFLALNGPAHIQLLRAEFSDEGVPRDTGPVDVMIANLPDNGFHLAVGDGSYFNWHAWLVKRFAPRHHYVMAGLFDLSSRELTRSVTTLMRQAGWQVAVEARLEHPREIDAAYLLTPVPAGGLEEGEVVGIRGAAMVPGEQLTIPMERLGVPGVNPVREILAVKRNAIVGVMGSALIAPERMRDYDVSVYFEPGTPQSFLQEVEVFGRALVEYLARMHGELQVELVHGAYAGDSAANLLVRLTDPSRRALDLHLLVRTPKYVGYPLLDAQGDVTGAFNPLMPYYAWRGPGGAPVEQFQRFITTDYGESLLVERVTAWYDDLMAKGRLAMAAYASGQILLARRLMVETGDAAAARELLQHPPRFLERIRALRAAARVEDHAALVTACPAELNGALAFAARHVAGQDPRRVLGRAVIVDAALRRDPLVGPLLAALHQHPIFADRLFYVAPAERDYTFTQAAFDLQDQLRRYFGAIAWQFPEVDLIYAGRDEWVDWIRAAEQPLFDSGVLRAWRPMVGILQGLGVPSELAQHIAALPAPVASPRAPNLLHRMVRTVRDAIRRSPSVHVVIIEESYMRRAEPFLLEWLDMLRRSDRPTHCHLQHVAA